MFASLTGPVDFYAELTKYGYLPRNRKAKKHSGAARNISNAMCAFDIETSRIDLPIPAGQEQNSHSFMYVWQFQINDKTIIGRTWDDFTELVAALMAGINQAKDYYGLRSEALTVIIWVHNLAYEFQFLSGYYPFAAEECFFRDVRKPIWVRMFDCLEFRCSYIQTNMSLKQLTEQMGVEQKLSGQTFDYSKIRYPWTELSDYELEYCVRDVRSLVECMRIRMEKDGDTLQSIPLTSTGYVRRDCVTALKPYFFQVKDMLPDLDQYRLLRKAFRGGNTHANRAYSGRILTNVYSFDMTSCYPAQQLTKQFPMHSWHFIDDRLSLDRILKFVGLNYAVVGLYQFRGLRLKNRKTAIPYISLARSEAYGFKLDNGRVLECEYIELALTEIDLQIVLRQYTYDEIGVLSAMVSRKDFLPLEYREVIQRYYDIKTKLKPKPGTEAEYIFFKSKEKLNGIYGMSAQDPVHADIVYDHGQYFRSDYTTAGTEKELRKAKFPYSWGVYTTAYARAALQEAIDAAGDRMVYCDTDSVKTIGPIDLSAINNKRIKQAELYNGYADDRYGIRHYVGVFEEDGIYDRFITCGAKRYAYEHNGKMSITVSGVSKAINEKTGIPFAVEELKCLENFREGFIWKESAGTMAVYNDDDNFEYDSGDGVIHIGKNVALVPTTYKMTYAKDYRLLLSEIELYGEYKSRRE